MANPRPTGTDIAMIAAGAVAGAILAYGVLGISGLAGNMIIGFAAALGAFPYLRRVQEQKKRDGGG